MIEPPLYVTMKLDVRRLPAEVFNRLCARGSARQHRRRREDEAWLSFGKPGRDVSQLSGVVGVLAEQEHWIPGLRIAQLRDHWDLVVGPAIAEHSSVVGLVDGVLTISAASPAWTTQLTFMVPQLTQTIRQRLSGLRIASIKVTGPRAHGFQR